MKDGHEIALNYDELWTFREEKLFAIRYAVMSDWLQTYRHLIIDISTYLNSDLHHLMYGRILETFSTPT